MASLPIQTFLEIVDGPRVCRSEASEGDARAARDQNHEEPHPNAREEKESQVRSPKFCGINFPCHYSRLVAGHAFLSDEIHVQPDRTKHMFKSLICRLYNSKKKGRFSPALPKLRESFDLVGSVRARSSLRPYSETVGVHNQYVTLGNK